MKGVVGPKPDSCGRSVLASEGLSKQKQVRLYLGYAVLKNAIMLRMLLYAVS